MKKITLAKKLKKLRQQEGITVFALAKEADVSFNCINFIEQENVINPRLDTCKSIARVFGITLSELLEGIGNG